MSSEQSVSDAICYIRETGWIDSQFDKSLKYHLDLMKYQDEKLQSDRDCILSDYNEKLDNFCKKQEIAKQNYVNSQKLRMEFKNKKVTSEYVTKQEYSRKQIVLLAASLKKFKEDPKIEASK